MRNLIAFALVFGVHWVGQIVAWALAGSPFTGQRSTAWDLLSFPAFAFGGELVDLDFWQLLTVNSAVWAAMFVAALAAWSKLRTRRTPVASRDPSSRVS